MAHFKKKKKKKKDFIKWAILDLFFLFVSSNFNTVDNKRSI